MAPSCICMLYTNEMLIGGREERGGKGGERGEGGEREERRKGGREGSGPNKGSYPWYKGTVQFTFSLPLPSPCPSPSPLTLSLPPSLSTPLLSCLKIKKHTQTSESVYHHRYDESGNSLPVQVPRHCENSRCPADVKHHITNRWGNWNKMEA